MTGTFDSWRLNLYGTGQSAQPDLYNDGDSSSGFSPSTIHPGDTWSVWSDVRNGGDANAGSFDVTYYASTNTNITASDYELGRDPISGIAAGAYKDSRLDLISFPSLNPGDYWIGWIIDEDNVVDESDESNNKAYNGEYQLTVLSPSEVADISVLGNGVEIIDGDTTPSTGDHTDFGSTNVSGGTVTRTFTIKNTGTGTLYLTGNPPVQISGTHASDFTVTQDPSSIVLANGGTTTFKVRFDPSGSGTRNAAISISNNDSDESWYGFSIQGRGQPGGSMGEIRGTKFHDRDADGQWDKPEEEGLQGWTIYAWDTTADPSKPVTLRKDPKEHIPDRGTITFDLPVIGASGILTDLDVTLHIHHIYIGSLDAYLISPEGTRIELFTGVGGSGDHFISTTLDDEAAIPITSGVPPFDKGPYRPEGALAAVDGEDPNGTWKLEITDGAHSGGYRGMLNYWSITFTTASKKSAETNELGQYVLTGLTPGIYGVREVPKPGWEQTAPAAGYHEVPISAGDVAEGVDFGSFPLWHVFYNGSTFDWDLSADTDGDGQFDPGEDGPNDDGAVATDKVPLLPGGIAEFANYTSYSRGIDGVMIDLVNLPVGKTPGAGDFLFHVGNDDTPGNWAPAAAPSSVSFRAGGGTGGTDRVTIVWPDGQIRNQWLQVTVLANEHTGLIEPDVFYFGNAVAEAGNSTTDAKVTTTDLLLARNNPRDSLGSPADVGFPYDYDRDGRVNATDVLLARNNQTSFINALRLIDLSAAAAASESPAVDELAWLYDCQFYRSDAKSLESEQNPAGEAVDVLLATFFHPAAPPG